MENPTVKRFVSLLLFGLGIGIAVWLKKAHDTGGEIEDRAIILMPVLLLTGLMGMINPGLMLSRTQMRTAPIGQRAAAVGIALLGVGIGFWLRFVVFKAWTSVR